MVRDLLVHLDAAAGLPAHAPYNAVFAIEMLFLGLALVVALPLAGRAASRAASAAAGTPAPLPAQTQTNPVEVS